MNNNKFRQCVSAQLCCTDGDDNDMPSAVRKMRKHFSIFHHEGIGRGYFVGVQRATTAYQCISFNKCAHRVQCKPDKCVINRRYGNFYFVFILSSALLLPLLQPTKLRIVNITIFSGVSIFMSLSSIKRINSSANKLFAMLGAIRDKVPCHERGDFATICHLFALHCGHWTWCSCC